MKQPVEGQYLFAVKRFRKSPEFQNILIKKVGKQYAYLGINGETKIPLSRFYGHSFLDGDWEIFENEQAYNNSNEVLRLQDIATHKISKITDLERLKRLIDAIDA